MELFQYLQVEKGITSVIGGGGKTTLTHVLGRELCRHGRVIIATTTKIWPPEEIPCCVDPTEEEICRALEKEPLVCVGNSHPFGKLTACGVPHLAALCDYVLVEADGSAQRPLKAHEAHEPVIPAGSRETILVLGVWGIGQPIEKAAHRPALYASLAGASPEEAVTPELAAKVLLAEGLHNRVLINGVETEEQEKTAGRLAALLHCPVIAGSLERGTYQCLF